MNMSIHDDIKKISDQLKKLPVNWDGKQSILELKEANYNWKQMEWWAFYFEYKSQNLLRNICSIPGDTYETTTFDLKTSINWDFKSKAIKSDSYEVILNDTRAMNKSIKQCGYHGEIIALCDVEYNDNDRTFQKWHTALKGSKSDYEKNREERTSISRYRKTKAKLCEILFVVLQEDDIKKLSIMKQGRNSNGKPRPPKYGLNLKDIHEFFYETLSITDAR